MYTYSTGGLQDASSKITNKENTYTYNRTDRKDFVMSRWVQEVDTSSKAKFMHHVKRCIPMGAGFGKVLKSFAFSGKHQRRIVQLGFFSEVESRTGATGGIGLSSPESARDSFESAKLTTGEFNEP